MKSNDEAQSEAPSVDGLAKKLWIEIEDILDIFNNNEWLDIHYMGDTVDSFECMHITEKGTQLLAEYINRLIAKETLKARIDELERFLAQHFDDVIDHPNYDWIIINVKHRIKELEKELDE